MNPYYEAGEFCTGPVCELCHKPTRNGSCGSCQSCEQKPCACPEPILGISRVADKPATYRFNANGKTTVWNFEDGINSAQTDTSLVVDIVDRLLRFSAERHTDTITAQELGEILHLADIGDVSTKGADNGASLVYKKDDTCGPGCFGASNQWVVWNPLDTDNIVTSAAYAYGYDSAGEPVTLQQPRYPDQYYNLAWNGKAQLSYQQPAVESAPLVDNDGYAYQMYVNPQTKQPYFVKVKV